jgi:deoxyribonuclease V
MILAIDVHYREIEAKVVGVLFNWEDIQPLNIIIEYMKNINDYRPGEFYIRELPCLLKIIEKIDLNELEAIIIDGHIYTDSQGSFGLGGKLWEVLNKQIPIIGVAKSPFFNNKETVSEVYRGESKKPLYVSAIDYNKEKAVENIKNMNGEFRLPTILKQMDTITKE